MLKIYCVLSYLSESYLSYNIKDRANAKSIFSETKPLVKKLLFTHFDLFLHKESHFLCTIQYIYYITMTIFPVLFYILLIYMNTLLFI